jgi:hypothetical protein
MSRVSQRIDYTPVPKSEKKLRKESKFNESHPLWDAKLKPDALGIAGQSATSAFRLDFGILGQGKPRLTIAPLVNGQPNWSAKTSREPTPSDISALTTVIAEHLALVEDAQSVANRFELALTHGDVAGANESLGELKRLVGDRGEMPAPRRVADVLERINNPKTYTDAPKLSIDARILAAGGVGCLAAAVGGFALMDPFAAIAVGVVGASFAGIGIGPFKTVNA